MAELAPAVRPEYHYQGQTYDSLEQLRATYCHNHMPMTHDGQSKAELVANVQRQIECIATLLADEEELERMVRELYGSYRQGQHRGLQQHEAIGLMMSLGAQIGVGDLLNMFSEVQQLFFRFDFDGDGEVDEFECTRLVGFVLRKVRDKLAPPVGSRMCDLPRKVLDEEYNVLKQLGQGGQGAVYLAEKKRGNGNKLQRVVKFYSKADANAPLDDIKEEFKLLTKLDHPRIARVLDIFEDNAKVYVVSEPYFGGDLTTLLAQASKHGASPTVGWLGKILKQVLDGLAYLHHEMVMHCDIKEPNIMIAGDSRWDAPAVVIIDFGMAKDFGGVRQGGTPGYMPPEVWQMSLWTAKGDIFSLAMVFWDLFNGQLGGPFATWDAPPYTKIRMATIHNAINCSRLPPGLKEVTEQMANKDFRRRPSARDVLANRFFEGLDSGINNAPVNTDTLTALNKLEQKNSVKNIMANELMRDANLSQLQHLNELFQKLDQDNSGAIGEEEARTAFAHLGFTESQADNLVSALIGDVDQLLHYSDFMAKLLLASRGVCEEQLATTFASIDKNGNGELDLQEMEELLANPNMQRLLGGRSAASLIAEMDTNGNGTIDFEEFRNAMLGDVSVSSKSKDAPWAVGDAARYYSRSKNQWLPCKIMEVNFHTSAVKLDIKPQQWMPPQVQQTLLVRGWHPWQPGDSCRYYDRNEGAVIEGRIRAVNPQTGEVALECNPDVWLPAWAVAEPSPPKVLSLRCTKGHRLKNETASTDLPCDECGEVLKSGAAMASCRKCNFNLCGRCTMVRHQEAQMDEESPMLVQYEAVVVRDHIAQGESQLTLKVGEIVHVTEEHPSGWIGGYKDDGDERPGWFPGFCVQPRQPPSASSLGTQVLPQQGTPQATGASPAAAAEPSPRSAGTWPLQDKEAMTPSPRSLTRAQTKPVPMPQVAEGSPRSQNDQSEEAAPLPVSVHDVMDSTDLPTARPQPHAYDTYELDSDMPTARVGVQEDAADTPGRGSASRRGAIPTPFGAVLSPRNDQQQREIARLQAELKTSKSELTAMRSELSAEQCQRSRAEEKVNECTKAVENAKEALRADRRERDRLIQELEEQNRQEKAERLKAERKLQAMEAERAREQADLQRELEAARNQVRSLQARPPQFSYGPTPQGGQPGHVRSQVSIFETMAASSSRQNSPSSSHRNSSRTMASQPTMSQPGSRQASPRPRSTRDPSPRRVQTRELSSSPRSPRAYGEAPRRQEPKTSASKTAGGPRPPCLPLAAGPFDGKPDPDTEIFTNMSPLERSGAAHRMCGASGALRREIPPEWIWD